MLNLQRRTLNTVYLYLQKENELPTKGLFNPVVKFSEIAKATWQKAEVRLRLEIRNRFFFFFNIILIHVTDYLVDAACLDAYRIHTG